MDLRPVSSFPLVMMGLTDAVAAPQARHQRVAAAVVQLASPSARAAPPAVALAAQAVPFFVEAELLSILFVAARFAGPFYSSPLPAIEF